MIALRPIHHVRLRVADLVRIPEEHVFGELYADMEQLGRRSFFRFDAAAVEAERHGLEAQGHPLPREGD